ncbi:MAG: hypothetical protein IPP10_18850 [Candidatus Competibacteraceae bacterium]|nr:hypothetical protein [Candidatus Competibacteraceae bacterium]
MRDEHKAILRVLGHFFLEHDQAGKALVVLQALRAVYPADAGIARSLSYAYLQAGRYQDALDAARQADAEPDAVPSTSCKARRCGASVGPMRRGLAWRAISLQGA